MIEKIAYDKGYRINVVGQVISPQGKIRKLKVGHAGYLIFNIADGQRRQPVLVHKLASHQWYGPCPDGMEVRHVNGNKLNNSQENLIYGTHQENMLDIPPEIRYRSAKIGARVVRKLSQDEAEELRKDRDDGMNYKQLMNKYSLAKSTVSYIVNKKTYQEE